MLGHVGGETAGRWRAAERLGHAANVVRPGTATDTQVTDAELVRLPREIGDLIAVADERIERRWEGTPTRRIGIDRIAQGLERWLLVMRAIGYRPGRNVPLDTRFNSGISVRGPRMQFRPTTSAPAASIRWQASSGVQPSRVSGTW